MYSCLKYSLLDLRPLWEVSVLPMRSEVAQSRADVSVYLVSMCLCGVPMSRTQRSMPSIFLYFSTLISLSPNLELAHRLASELLILSLGCKHETSCLAFYVDAEDLNLCPHACMIAILSHSGAVQTWVVHRH